MQEGEKIKKKVLVPIFNRAHYGRLRSVLRAIHDHPLLELQIMVGLPYAYGSFWKNLKHARPNSHKESLLWYIRARILFLIGKIRPSFLDHDFLVRNIRREGFRIHSYVPLMLDGGAPETMTKVVGFGMVKIAEELERLRPDMVFVNADRFEMMAVALAAAYTNIVLVHNEAGDISGTIDESVRHAITKIAHLHFSATEASRTRVIQMGENPEFVFTVGSPAIDNIVKLDLAIPPGAYGAVDTEKPFLLVAEHPVTTETDEENNHAISEVIRALDELALPTIFLGSNMDAGSKIIGQTVKKYLEREKAYPFFFIKHLPPDEYYRLIARATCAMGNSSSFIREGAYFGTPVVLVGTRQRNRDRGENIVEVKEDAAPIVAAARVQLKKGRYKKDTYFGDGTSGKKMADILATKAPALQKRFFAL
jgi:UDP-hydrolysing UDP-N-acetyl-D-glucosamine 2-epimerase